MVKVENLDVEIKGKRIISDINFEIKKGEWLMIIGPNGAGKSTIIKAISSGCDYKGKIYLNNKELKTISSKKRARIMGVLSQRHNISYSFSVEDVVKLGRYAHRTSLWQLESKENNKIEKALKITGLLELKNQNILTLSGGELQRVFLAQVFAAEPEIIVLDEPTNHLDLVYQKQIFELIRNYLKENNCTVISVVHDLSLARKYGNKALLINKGIIEASGSIEQVYSKEVLQQVYSMDVYKWMNDLHNLWR